MQPTIKTDLLVVGGSMAGVAAACAAAEEGCRVLLIEQRTHLGEERTASGAMWMSPAEIEAITAQFAIQNGEFSAMDCEETSRASECPIRPDAIKIALEDALLRRGVELLYQVRPLSWKSSITGGYTIEAVGKAGMLTVHANRIVDATVHGLVARMTENVKARYAGREVKAQGVMEFIRVKFPPGQGLPAVIQVPEELGGTLWVHQGHQDEGHILMSYTVNWLVDMSPTGRNQLEIKSRFTARNLARWLILNHPAFKAARWVGLSYECQVAPLHRIRGSGATDPMESSYRTGEGLWIASGCGDISDEDSVSLANDLRRTIRLGAAIGVCAATRDGVPMAAAGAWSVSQVRDVDTLVVGGGTSGVPAAVSAAENGCSTLLVEMNPALGGAGTLGGVDSYWYGRRGAFNARVASAVAEEHRWMGIPETQAKWNLEAKMYAWLNLATSAGVEVLLNSVIVDVLVDEAGKVVGAFLATRDGIVLVNSKIVIDATGDGDVAVKAEADYVYGSDRDSVAMWYSMIPFPKPGQSRNNWTSTVDVDSAQDLTRSVVSARRRFVGHDHSIYIAPRETRHILGSVRLTLTDQLRFRQWPDVVNLAYSNHDMKGHSTSDWLRMGLIPPNLEVEIPLRALIPAGVGGLLVTGKAISATHDALPAVRMQADLENLGSVCGVMAGLCKEFDCEPGELPVNVLQDRLVQQGFLPPTVVNRTIRDASMTEEEMQTWVEKLDDAENLYDYSDMGFDEVRRDPIPIVMVCTAGPAILPLLRKHAADPQSKGRLMTARALAWYGDPAATPILVAEIEKYLGDDELPYRDSKIRNSQASPDQGAMPDLCYLLHTLAMVRDERSIDILEKAVPKLRPTMEKFMDQRSGIFHYVDSLCDIAEQLGDPRCIPSLKALHQQDLFRNRGFHGLSQPDYFEERAAYLELLIGRSLARCTSRDGVYILIDYLSDSRRTLYRHAYHELKDISGMDFGQDTNAWLDWIRSVESLEAKPWVADRGAS